MECAANFIDGSNEVLAINIRVGFRLKYTRIPSIDFVV